jgi:hypothetical protein
MKYLCIGNPTSATDDITTRLAVTKKTINHGLAINIEQAGFYHISLADISILEAETFVEQFDELYFLDQGKETYSSELVYNNTRALLLYIKNWNVKPLKIVKLKSPG